MLIVFLLAIVATVPAIRFVTMPPLGGHLDPPTLTPC
jgi:hypothetical protein